jgi:hypothetical protein
MRRWQRVSRSRRWLATLLAVGVLVAAASTWGTPPGTAQSAASTAVYLPDPTAPALDLAAARRQGVRIVTGPTALVDVASGTATGAILLDRARFDALPAAWLAAQVRQGRIVVGFDVPADRFARRAGLDRNLSTANMRLDWQGTPFYSWAYQRESGGRITNAGLHSDALASTAAFLGRLRGTLDQGGGMQTASRPLPRREDRPAVSALAVRVRPDPAASTEDISPYGAALSRMYTHDASGLNSGWAYEWRGAAYARDGYSGDSGRITLLGWNNSDGWHTTGTAICYLTGGAPGDCAIPPIPYDAGPAGILPGSQSTDRYVTTENFIFCAGGAQTFYTSADGRHSSAACFTRAGNCP